MSYPATRMLAMLELLQAHHGLGGRDLAQRLGVDERTVRRYAARLAELGIPVAAERGRYGGYQLMPGYKLPPLMLTDDEATAVVLGLLAGRRLGLAAEATEAALAKIRRVLPATLREQVGALEETLDFTLAERAAPTPASRAVLTLAAAIRDRRRVTLRHRSWKGDQTERELDGHGLVFHSGRWYVTGHDHRSGEIRTFRVDRISSVVPGTASYEIPEESDPVRQVTASLVQVPYAHSVEVIMRVPLAEASRRIPPSVATLTETPDGVLLRTRAESLDGMAAMLAGLGFPFTILSPRELHAAVRRLAERLLEQTVE
ncbi:YafY family transcriptional regulator [Nonomuraea sp. SMC257]|uniref:YafY family transcriptional regulator n=1 Tax=Nonomuraea montanisoli TaxID=2741721 RepID=A0A7Y6ICH7_9ACTN|nr:YafY family protein [Nonomuraea montanisoli]NUW35728.1 YafY family transcriptional regulator [Nonomuraea montanisoli]